MTPVLKQVTQFALKAKSQVGIGCAIHKEKKREDLSSKRVKKKCIIIPLKNK
jgi:hypothetical protein